MRPGWTDRLKDRHAHTKESRLYKHNVWLVGFFINVPSLVPLFGMLRSRKVSHLRALNPISPARGNRAWTLPMLLAAIFPYSILSYKVWRRWRVIYLWQHQHLDFTPVFFILMFPVWVALPLQTSGGTTTMGAARWLYSQSHFGLISTPISLQIKQAELDWAQSSRGERDGEKMGLAQRVWASQRRLGGPHGAALCLWLQLN